MKTCTPAPVLTRSEGLTLSEFTKEFNTRFQSGETFLFLIDYKQNYFDVIDYHRCSEKEISFSTPEFSLPAPSPSPPEEIIFEKSPIPFSQYQAQFQQVMEEIRDGNTYLLNLTTETLIHTNLNLKQIYSLSRTPYRLNYQGRFLSFSPETFVRVSQGIITAFPMKGTYTDEATATASSQKLNIKELSEQTTVVDRVRNDLSQICRQVRVEDFLTIQRVETHRGKLYQTISQVIGELGEDFYRNPAKSLLKLLPAASVTGAPRDSTVAIINRVESHHRGFYTGVWGVAQRGTIDSAVIIRYLEKRGEHLYYKSGGGITFMSQADKEYQEMIDKIYLPFKSHD